MYALQDMFLKDKIMILKQVYIVCSYSHQNVVYFSTP